MKKIIKIFPPRKRGTMVMTYVFDSNWEQSARYLDNVRVGKQRAEAFQILLAIQDLRIMGQVFYNQVGPMPIFRDDNKTQRDYWVATVLQLYNKWERYIVRTDTIWFEISKSTPIPSIDGIRKLYDKRYIGNPIVRMWLGYEEALMEYINVHIDEHVRRGVEKGIDNNKMRKYDLSKLGPYTRPSWIYNPDVHREHVAKLMDQERTRIQQNHCIIHHLPFEVKKGKRKPTKPQKEWLDWYSSFEPFLKSGPFSDYTWL